MADGVVTVVPLICGRCSQRMTAGREQVVYQCRACGSVWNLRRGHLLERSIRHLAGSGQLRLPFWSVAFMIECQSGTVSDLAAFMPLCGSLKQPEERAAQQPELYIPAFELHPHQAVKLARNILVRFPRFSDSGKKDQPFEAVVLSECDLAPLAELTVLAALVEERRRNPNFLASFSLRLAEPCLVTIPFEREGNRLFQRELNLEV